MIIKKWFSIFLSAGFFLISCEDYLDKAPESDFTERDVFGNFVSFQGFIEEMYNSITCVAKIRNNSGWWFADEMVSGRDNDNPNRFDLGNYWPGYHSPHEGDFNPSNSSAMSKRIWPGGWYVIRKANLGLANFHHLRDATQEEKDIIKGQLLFFRGYNHLELISWWGGLPYIDTLLAPTMDLNLPRLTFEESALKAFEDLEAAARLLPVNWDETTVGRRTLGDNVQRVNRSIALGYAGKSLLYAASPLMQRSSNGSTAYDAELCKKAAEAFAGVIKLSVENHVFALQPFDTYLDQFYIQDAQAILPGGVEVMWGPTIHNPNVVRFNMWVSYVLQHLGGQWFTFAPAHNYIQNFGMANGLPLDDPESGYNPDDPWDDRDPRFYKIHVIDGDRLANSSTAGTDQFAQFFRGGRHRAPSNGTMTGYLTKKYVPIPGYNQFDGLLPAWSVQMRPPYMRLADIYLMYAEAVLHGYGSATANAPGSLTAVEAVNTVRARAGVPPVHSKYTGSKEAFMETLIKERAVELAYEVHRFHDLRRWMLAGSDPYLDKTELLFDRDPVTQKPINIEERVIRRRVFEEKHWWLPLPRDQVNIYREFQQNPGW
jgi:starch-binding outer membrane protein, SusD/RagB family